MVGKQQLNNGVTNFMYNMGNYPGVKRCEKTDHDWDKLREEAKKTADRDWET